jgi:TP901 family phage tail tape measure protein
MSDTEAKIEISATTARLAAGLRQAAGMVNKFGGDVAGSIKKKMFSKESIGSFMGNMGANLASRGIDLFKGEAQDVMDFEGKLTRLGIAGNLAGGDLNRLRESARGLSSQWGINASEVIDGAQTYVDLTGDVKGAQDAMGSFTKISAASGSSISDIAQATAALRQSMKLDPKDIEATFSGMIAQGKMGAVSLKDFAGELSSLAPKFAKFKGGTGTEGIAKMGAAFQVARQGFGSASQAATGLEALMGALSQNAGKFEKAGVKIFDVHKGGKKTFKSFDEIIDRIGKSKLMNDPTALGKAFGSKEAQDAFNMLNQNVALYGDLMTAAKDTDMVNRDAATWQESAAGKMEASMQTLKNSVAEAFTPERIKAFADMIQAAAKAIGVVVAGLDALQKFANPFDTANKVHQDLGDVVDREAQMAKLQQDLGSHRAMQRFAGHMDKEGNYTDAEAAKREIQILSKMANLKSGSKIVRENDISPDRIGAFLTPAARTGFEREQTVKSASGDPTELLAQMAATMKSVDAKLGAGGPIATAAGKAPKVEVNAKDHTTAVRSGSKAHP